MRRQQRNALWALSGLVALGLVGLGAATAQQRPGGEGKAAREKGKKIDPRADALVKRMSDFMAKTRAFTVHTEGELEVVLEDGQKLEFPFESEVSVQRPNKLRADRRGAMTDLRLVYDGREVVLHGKRLNMYARADAPKDLDGTIDKLRDDLGLDLPAADLLYTDAYEGLMEDVVSGVYVGPEMVRGEVCEHVAFRGKEVDFQLWIRSGDQPTPCRYVVTTTGMKSQPEFAVDLTDWELSPRFEEDTFAFEPPSGAVEIDFLTAKEMKKHEQETKKKGGRR